MRYFYLLTFLSLFFGCDKQKELILEAEINGFHNNETIRLFDDSTYVVKRVYELDSLKNKTITGKFKILNNNLILLGNFKFNGFIKNNFLESNEEYIKYEIINSKIDTNSKIDFKKFPNYTTFTFNKSKEYNHFDENSVSYDLTENDLFKIDSILPICMNKTKYFKDLKNTDRYTKQCIATKNLNDEIEVWIKCACSGISKNAYKYFIGITHDGGPCYLNLKINLTTENCFDVFVNGS
jgi:hypothetical protein